MKVLGKLSFATLAALILVSGFGHVERPARANAPTQLINASLSQDDGGSPLPVSVEITGPEKVNPGDLIVLEADTNADSLVWFLGNSDKTFLPVEDGRRLVFSSGTPGVYRFCVAAFLSGQDPAQDVFTVTVGTPPAPGPQPGPGPAPGPNPPPGPSPDRPDGFAGKVFDEAMKVVSDNRKAEALKIAQAFEAISSEAAGLSSMTPASMVSKTSQRLKNDLTEAERKKWDSWEASLGGLLKELGLASNDKLGHIEAWDGVGTGLRAVN